MKPMWKSLLEGISLKESARGDGAGEARLDRLERRRFPIFLTFTSRGRSVDEREYIEGTWRLKAMIIWARLETGYSLSRYAVKFSSFQRISGLVEAEENDGDLGDERGSD